MFKRLLLSIAILCLLAPSAFAESQATQSTEPTVTSTTSTEDSSICYDCYGSNGIYFTVNTTSKVDADKVYVYGTYTIEQASSRKEAISTLRKEYSKIKDVLDDYGSVIRTSMYAYNNWEYTNTYDATLSIRVDLSKLGTLSEVQDLLYENDFDNWYEALVLDTTDAESKVTKILNARIEARKKVYEEVLGYKLGKPDGLTIYSWPDSTTFDEATGKIELNISANVWYNDEQ